MAEQDVEELTICTIQKAIARASGRRTLHDERWKAVYGEPPVDEPVDVDRGEGVVQAPVHHRGDLEQDARVVPVHIGIAVPGQSGAHHISREDERSARVDLAL